MRQFDDHNTIFQKAVAFVNQTNRHLFLTGKAGTGKTTFLRYIRDNCFKKIAVVAPTGVAAINAGGVTIHSFFQLPMGTFLPTKQGNWDTFDARVYNHNSLFKNLRLNAAKRELLQELELLIIDEVSMVRADTLDAIDAILKHVRQQPLMPFGGVQMLYIGDLFQLPPVVKPDEWKLLEPFYKSHFFFDATSLQQSSPVYIELKKIYRQSDDTFIHILNNIRNNCCTAADLQHLHQYYQPGFSPAKDDNYITLTSHNDKADAINRNELDKLPDKLHVFPAIITGEFNERSYPAEPELHLKTGAQIMFIKNDKGENRRYYNGKIGVIDSIDSEKKITVSFPGEQHAFELEPEKWQNIRYRYNKEKDTFEEEELGTFTQYPIRLAWAITIHKSQGLTFDKAIIDAGASFAAGQVYVALSRLTGLAGLVLRSRIQPENIRTDERVVQFIRSEMPESLLQETLQQEQQAFIRESLLKNFNWEKFVSVVEQHLEDYEDRQLLQKHTCINWASALVRTVHAQREVAVKFLRQLNLLFVDAQADGYLKLHQRMEAAVQYFIKEIDEGVLASIEKHLNEISVWPKIKKYAGEVQELQRVFERQKQHLLQAVEMTRAMHTSIAMPELLQLAESMHKPVPVSVDTQGVPEEASNPKKPKRQKGDSHRATLQLFREGKSIQNIAKERKLAPVTIEMHLVSFIETGEMGVLELVSQEKLDKISSIIAREPGIGSWPIKQILGDEVTYGQIMAALKHFGKVNALKEVEDDAGT